MRFKDWGALFQACEQREREYEENKFLADLMAGSLFWEQWDLDVGRVVVLPSDADFWFEDCCGV